MNYKILGVSILIALLVGVYVGKKFCEPLEVIKDRIVTVTRTVTIPGGATTIETVITEDRISKIPLPSTKPEYFLRASADMQKQYSIAVSKRLFADLYVGAGVNSQGVLEAHVLYGF